MLVDFQTLFTLMSGNQLNLAVGKPLRGKTGDHLMSKQMRMNGLGNASLLTILLDDLLDAPRRERSVTRRFKEIMVLRVGSQMALQHQAKAFGEQDVAVFTTFPFRDKDFTLVKVNIFDLNRDQLAHSHRCKEKQFEHDFMLKVATLLNDTKELFQFSLRQKLRQLPFAFGFSQSQLSARLLTNIDEVVIAKPLFACDAGKLSDDLRFRFFIRFCEML
jgi:hypothetical protein